MNIQTIALIRLEEARQIVQPPQAVALLVGNPQAQKTLTGGYPSTAVDPSDDNTQSGDTQNGSDGQNSPNDQGISDEGSGASGQDDQGGLPGVPSDGENNSEENSQNDNSASDESADEPEKQRDPMAWQSQLDTTKLDASIAVETDKIDALENNQLPAEIPATLRVSFELTPGEDGLLKDDWIETTLPSFLSFENASLEVFRLNADGTETTEKIANAEIKDGVLKITFIDAAATEDTSVTVRGYVDIEASLASSLLGEEESEQLWIAQTGEDGTQRLVKLVLPTYQAVLDAWNTAHNLFGILGGDDGSVTAQNEGEAFTALETETSVRLQSFNSHESLQIIWCDNNSGSRPSISSLQAGYKLQFSLDGQNYFDLLNADGTFTTDAQSSLYSNNPPTSVPAWANLDTYAPSVNSYLVNSGNLPSGKVIVTRTPVDADGNGEQDVDINDEPVWEETSSDPKTIHWRIVDTNNYPGYTDGENSNEDTVYKMLTAEVSFTVVGKTGGENLSSIFGDEDAGDFHFSATIDGQEAGRETTFKDLIDNGKLALAQNDDGSVTLTGDLPMYDSDGYPIVYYAEYTGDQEGEDYYQVSYDNSASTSHGSATDRVYMGGTMTLRHAGETTFNGTKVWLDNNSSERPATTFTLWRYSTNGSAATASQVQVSQLDEAGGDVVTNATGYVTVQVPEGSSSTVDLHELLVQEYGDAINSLPKYDPDGYPYIYCMREDAVVGYEQVFGLVDASGSLTPSTPQYENEEGTGLVPAFNSWQRPDTDHFVYNGGTISNRLTGTTTTNMTKSWEIAAFQDSLQDVVCTFQAQSRVKGSADDAAWANVSGESATQTLSGWNAETLTKTITESFPKYDSQGRELEYRWLETNVTLEGQATSFQQNDDGSATFQIQVTDPEGSLETLEFTSTPVTTTNDDGSIDTVITNTFNNTTDQHVDKYWEQPDGSQAQIAPDPNYSDPNAVIQLFQDGQLIGEFTLDGTTDETAMRIEGLGDATWQETSSYHADFQNLPKYSPEGKRYTYLVLEKSKEGWTTERTYDAETRTTRIDNYLPEGEGSEIRITKSWIDGDDAAHRYDVRIDLVAARDMYSQGTNADGQPNVSYTKGQVVATVTLSAEELWYGEVDVPIGGLTYNDFIAQETALIADDGTEYPVLTRDQAALDPEYEGELWINAGWTNPDNRRVATPEHVYEVRSTTNTAIGSVEATNRRLGLFDLTLTKDWGDSLGDFNEGDTNNPRPEATFTISCAENPGAFSLNEEGNLVVSVSGNTLPVTDVNGNPVKAEIVDTNGNAATNGNARISIDRNLASSTYQLFGLPKYDANGMNVHYDVVESWTSDSGDYQSTKTVGDYLVEEGARHFHDTQTISFDNTRSGTRDIVFYKTWHDNYVSETLNQRPDIYLTLYRAVLDEDGNLSKPEAVPGYIHFSWSALAESTDAANEQMVTISGLSKYDSNGAEYIYYASESMSADGESLGYGDVQFDYSSIETADADEGTDTQAAQGADNAVEVDSGAESDDPTVDGTGWAIREDGTFVNRLDSDLTVQGTKLWENVPGNVDQGDLPKVTIYLQQKLAGDENAWGSMVVHKNDDGTWTVDGAIAQTSELYPEANNQYTYTIDHTGDNVAGSEVTDDNALPRYDENGNLYEYRAIEVIWGLEGQPGGFTADQVDGQDITKLLNGELSLVGNTYVVQHGESGSFLLRNVYEGDTGKLTVKKLFSGRDADDAYPDVTFDVYRYYVDEEGNVSDAGLAASHTVTGDEFKAADTAKSGNASYEYTFENLLIYAPDGSRWIYYVVEHSINGYTTTVGTGDISDIGQLDAGIEVGNGMRSENLGTFDGQGAITDSVIKDDETVDVTFGNTYAPDNAQLNGQKVWTDYGDIFSVRPGPTEFLKSFMLKRTTASGMSEDVVLQSSDSAADNYIVWTNSEDGAEKWTFTISNVEKWAPDGTAWSYTLKENLGDTSSYYNVVGSDSSTVSADAVGAQFSFQNALRGRAEVHKKWIDGDDPYDLRPGQVTVRLQARTAVADTSGNVTEDYSEWQDAYTVLRGFVNSDEELDNNGFSSGDMNRTLTANNSWSASWSRLPVLASLDRTSGTKVYAIQYRAVETTIGIEGEEGYQEIAAPNDDGKYEDNYYPYQPDQSDIGAWTGDAQNGWSTTISNELKDTSISATKTWDDQEDAWDTRPAGEESNEWTATFFLQHSTDDGKIWEWVVEADSGANPSGSASQTGVVRLTVSGSDETASATWNYLPQYDTSGKEYQYRVVEQVPGSYDVPGATQVADTDTAHRYYVVSTTAGIGDVSSTQSFTNNLRTVDLTGTKQWEDFGSGLAPEFDENDLPEMTLWRAVDNGDGTFGQAESVLKYGNPAPQPTWTKNGNGTWTFAYSDLPAANASDQDYVYWATESAGFGNTGGFYPVYGTGGTQSEETHGAGGTTVDKDASAGEEGQQTNETITNTATKLSLDKISNWEQGESLNDIELSVQSRNDNKTYGVWQRDEAGSVTTWTLLSGGTKEEVMVEANEMRGEASGYIVGLPEGDYKVVETGDVPDGYAIAPEVYFKINANGTATFEGAYIDGEKVTTNVQDVVIDTENGVHAIELTAEDPVLRGHLQLTKYVSDDGTADGANRSALAGATFSLYRQGESGVDQLVAEGLTSNAQGVVTTVNSNVEVTEEFAAAYDNKYGQLRDGLPEGTYYFVEISTTSGAVLPSGDAAKSPTLTITQDNHYDYTEQVVSRTMENEKFNATVILHKYDTADNAGIEGINFTLSYTPEGSTTASSRTVTTGAGGELKLENLEKGSYILTEQSNSGYANSGFGASFTIGNEDDDQTFDIKNVSDGAGIDFKVTSGEGDYTDGTGIPNVRSEGQVTLNKSGNNTAIDATFDLQMKTEDGSWSTVVPGLETANKYELTWDKDGLTATATDAGDENRGVLVVTGLTWNTYRFVETATAPGYLPDNTNGDITSSEFTIGRTTPNMATSVTVQNAQTSLELNKQNGVGEALDGAVFTVTPVGGSVFADSTTAAKTVTASNGGHAVLTGQLVVGGTYEIYESTAPTGYDPADGTFRVTVKDNGSLEVVGGDSALPDGWARLDLDEDGQTDNQFSFIATNNHLAIELVKVSSNNGDLKLEGAQFRLAGMCMDNNTVHDYTTGEDGTIHIEPGLMGGVEYTLTELTPPDGYISMDPLQFRMNARGEIEVIGTAPEGWTVGEDKISFTAANDPVNLQITKIDPDGSPLFGAVFSITPVDGSTFADGTTDTETLRTGEDGSLFMGAKLVVGNSYDITEVSAPEGYEKVVGTMRVTVADDGSINVVGSVDENGQVTGQLPPTGYEKVSGNAFEVRVTNEPVEITINKVDSTDGGTRLDGAVFEVTGVFANSNAESTREFTTASDGTLVGVSNISAELKSGQTYTLTEKTAPAGYELIEGTLTFTVNEDGTITPQGNVPAGYSVEQGNVSIVAADNPIDLAFFKKDLGNDNELAGAEFMLSGTFVDNATHETSQLTIGFTTAGTAISFGNLSHEGNTYSVVAGQTYVLTETKAPSGYELLEPFSFTVGVDGAIVPAEGYSQVAAGEEGYVISNDQGGVVTLTAHDKPIEVVLAKTSSTNEQLALTGAVFELYRGASAAEGDFVEQVSTGTDGKVALENLVGGTTYTLHEVMAPAGYELLPDVTFTVETDGTVTLSENAPAGYTVTEGEDGVVTFTAADTPIEAQLVKTDEAGTPLAGAVFSIQGTFTGDYAQEREITLDPTGEDGITSIPVAALIANETYTIAELTAPDGYERAGSVKFTVAADGTITILSDDANAASSSNNTATGDTNTVSGDNSAMVNNGGASAVAGTNGTGTFAASSKGTMAVITATNHPVEITITKTDGAQGLLPGAEFTATSTDGTGGATGSVHSVTAVTGEDGVAVLSGLIAGKEYTLAETKAPAGYELLTDTLTFTVQPDGTIDAGLLPPAAFSIGITKDAVSVTDNPLEVSLVKQASNGAPLAGAEFTVEGEFPDGQTSKTFTSDESGIVFNQLQLTGSAEGTCYSVTETKAPDGYAQPEGSLNLLVYEDGSVQIAESSSADMKQYASVAFTSGTAVVTLNNEPLPGTELPQTGDSRIMPLLAGAFGLLGLWALVMGGIAYRRFRDIKK